MSEEKCITAQLLAGGAGIPDCTSDFLYVNSSGEFAGCTSKIDDRSVVFYLSVRLPGRSFGPTHWKAQWPLIKPRAGLEKRGFDGAEQRDPSGFPGKPSCLSSRVSAHKTVQRVPDPAALQHHNQALEANQN